ncbi:MAG: hypothetical protein RBR15_01385 [Sphaerochaeta sp.]|nr:hypothetical protein [Sphaerochaeta sp.]
MKKLLVLVLIVPILALAMISCDADMRSNLAGLMGGFGGNLYEGAGLIVVNTAQAEAAAATVATIGTGSGAKPATTSGLGVTIPDPGSTTMLAPQGPGAQGALKDNLADAFNSEAQKKKLLEELGKPVTDTDQQAAAAGTVGVLNATLDALKDELITNNPELAAVLEQMKLPDVGDGSTLTQGDLLMLQMMTDLISNTVATLEDIGGTLGGVDETKLGLPANQDKVLGIIADALFAAEAAEQISGAGSLALIGDTSLGGFLESLTKGRGTRGDGFTLDDDAEEYLPTINSLVPRIVTLMGITHNGTAFEYTAAKYNSFLLNQKAYRASMEQALKMAAYVPGSLDSSNLDLSTLVKYGLAVLITEHDAFVKHEGLAANEIILAYLNANQGLGLGTLSVGDTLNEPTITGFSYDDWPAFIKNGAPSDVPPVIRNLPYYVRILNNLIVINKVDEISKVTEALEEFRDDTEDGLAKWYNEL